MARGAGVGSLEFHGGVKTMDRGGHAQAVRGSAVAGEAVHGFALVRLFLQARVAAPVVRLQNVPGGPLADARFAVPLPRAGVAVAAADLRGYGQDDAGFGQKAAAKIQRLHPGRGVGDERAVGRVRHNGYGRGSEGYPVRLGLEFAPRGGGVFPFVIGAVQAVPKAHGVRVLSGDHGGRGAAPD